MKSHHKQIHGESLAGKSMYVCGICSKEFEGYDTNTNRFCSAECKYQWDTERMTGSGSPTWKGAKIEVECYTCGDTFCRYKSQLEKYDRNYCSTECKSDDQKDRYTGKDNPSWKGGKVSVGTSWSRISEDVVEYDGKCLSCGISADIYEDETGRRLDVHHIEPRRQFDDVDKSNTSDNLVSLCRQCHNAIEAGKAECPEPPSRNI